MTDLPVMLFGNNAKNVLRYVVPEWRTIAGCSPPNVTMLHKLLGQRDRRDDEQDCDREDYYLIA